MSDDARPLIDNPYRASHTPIYAGDVNVTDLMARAWDRGFAAGDERIRLALGKIPQEQLGRVLRAVADDLAEIAAADPNRYSGSGPVIPMEGDEDA